MGKGNIRDLTGQKFNLLLAIRPRFDIKGNGTSWDFRCDCGREVSLLGCDVRRGNIKSCGCAKGKIPYNAQDIIGKSIGEITIIQEVGKGRRNVDNRFKCRCFCEKEFIERGSLLIKEKVKSCGCHFIDPDKLLGKRFSALEVIDSIYNKHGCRYVCVCDCGEMKLLLPSDLIKKNSTSCGCGIHSNNARIKEDRTAIALSRAYRKSIKRHCEISPDIPSDMTRENFYALFQGNCFYCGRKPSNSFPDKTFGNIISYQGIDRVDSNRGYFKDNCVSCCTFCNNFKSDLTQEAFLEKIQQIADFHGLQK